VDRRVRLLGFGVLVAAGRTQLCSIKPPRFSWRLPVMVLAATGLVSVLVTVIEPLGVTNRRALTVVEPRLGEPKAISAWLAERNGESAALPDQARQRLFDDWFAGAYDEEPIARRAANRPFG
jgi:hypothetical protein